MSEKQVSAYKLREAIKLRKPFDGVPSWERLLLLVYEYGEPIPHGRLENKCRTFLKGDEFEKELLNQVANGNLTWKQSGPRGGIRYECLPAAFGILSKVKTQSLSA